MRYVVALLLVLTSSCGTIEAAYPDGGTPHADAGVANVGGMGGADVMPSDTGGRAGGVGGGGVVVVGGASGAAGDPGGSGGSSSGPLFGPNLITNGDFSNGAVGWQANSGGTIVPSTVVGGVFCVDLTTAWQIVAIGWPAAPVQPTALVAGNTYRLSFEVRANVRMDATMFEDKLGQTVDPYNADFDSGDALAPGVQTITHTIVPMHDDLAAGLVFLLHGPPAGTMVCVDSVKLQQVVTP